MLDKNNLIDIGVNLTHSSFQHDLSAVLQRAHHVGVSKLIVTGTSVTGSQQALTLVQQYPNLYATAGVHPHEANQWNDKTAAFCKQLLTQNREVVAVGECGLDFNRNYSPQAAQERCFIEQLELACELKKPLFLHERDAHDCFVRHLAEYRQELAQVVVHCFTGTASQLATYLELDCHIGITGWVCDERRGQHLHDFIGMIPGNRLMLETDAPYLLPRDLNPKPQNRRNEPCYLPHILTKVAAIIGKSAAQLAQETTDTANRFFNL